MRAIDTGQSDVPVEQARRNDACAFGKWLSSGVNPADQRSPHYARAVELHTRFHQAAGRVLTFALEHHKNEAASAIRPGTPFAVTSAELTMTVLD